jgi:HAD superfamily hydrolase (TIGR01484 family)
LSDRVHPAPLFSADLSRVQAVFTDVDGTLTTKGRLLGTTLRAIEWLVALVSGRPAGWGECWARQLPVAGVIVENGGLTFIPHADGTVQRQYAQAEGERKKARARLEAVVSQALKKVRGARLSSDSRYTEVDLAIDYAEEADLGPSGADRIEAFMRAHGVTAVRSSVHVNCWVGDFDKASAVRRFLRQQWKTSLKPDDRRFLYLGDSFNDAPLFKAFPLSVGVANVADVLPRIEAAPRYITRSREGRGFGEVADAVVRAKKRRK